MAGRRHSAAERDGADRSGAGPDSQAKARRDRRRQQAGQDRESHKEQGQERGKSESTSAKAAKGKTKAAKADKTSDSDDSDDSSDDSASSSDSKFGKVGDLLGKRVAVVTGNEATRGLLELVLGHYGVPLAKVTVSEIDPKDIADAIKANKVDVLFVAGPAAGRAISDVVAAATQNGAAPNFIAIDQAEGIAKRNADFSSVDVDAGTFGGSPPSPSDDLTTLSFAEYLVARRRSVHR